MKIIARELLIDNASTDTESQEFINNSCDVLGLQISGTFTSARIEIKGAITDEWFVLSAVNLGDFSLSASNLDSTGLYEIPLETVHKVKAVVSNVSGGSVSVYGQFANTAI